MNMNKTEAKR